MSEHSAWEDDPHLGKSNGKDWLEYLALTTDYLSIPFCTLSFFFNTVIIYVILRYRRLKNRTNLFLVNFAIFHILYILSTPVFYMILDIFYVHGVEKSWFCTWSKVENFGIALLITFLAGFGIDVVIEQLKPNWFLKYDKRFLYVFAFFYFLHTMIFVITACICFKEGFNNLFNFYFLTIYYLLIVILLLYLGINNRDGKFVNTKAYVLNISIMVLLMWLPLFVCYNLINVLKNRQIEMTLWYLAFLPEYMAYSCPAVVTWQLWKHNKQFKTAFRKLFKRHVTLTEYEELFVVESHESIEQSKI